jgi:CxxC motif-containing protein
MKKINLVLIALVVILLGAYITNKYVITETKRIDRHDFTITEVEKVDKIILSSKKPETVTLTKNGETWQVNGKYSARKSSINTLLETISTMEVKNPVLKNRRDVIYKNMAAEGLKMEVFKDGKLNKTIYIGNDTPNKLGTYMLLKNAEAPYAIHIPGFSGFLSSRFYTDPLEWRDLLLFESEANQISKVSVSYNYAKDKNFHITKDNDIGKFTLYDHKNEIIQANPMKIGQYLAGFKTIYAEVALDETDLKNIEKIKSKNELFSIKIEKTDGSEVKFDAYQKYAIHKTDDRKSLYLEEDKERVHITNGKEYYVAQLFILNKFLKEVNDFK